MEINQFLTQTTQILSRRIIYVEDELMSKPRGKLLEEIHEGRPYFTQVYNEGGRRIRRGISRKKDLVEGLIQKEVLEDQLKTLELEKAAFDYCVERINAIEIYDVNDTINKLTRRCPHLSRERIMASLTTTSDDEWESAGYERSNYRPEELKQITSRGLKVRSKSEVLIAEKLYQYNIQFRYEQIIREDNIVIIPDFTIKRSDGKMFYWEHEGLTNDKSYIERQFKKAQLYAAMNIVPWDNYIVTYDNSSGMIDLRTIEFEIQNKLLVDANFSFG